MSRLLLACAPLLLVAAQPPAFAQQPTEGAKPGKCEPKKKKKGMFGSLAGSVAGSIASNALGRSGVPTSVIGVSIPVSSLLTEAIMSKLDCKEQVQAATATDTAVRGGVGTKSEWTSETRPGVRGSSTARAQRAEADGSSCMLITDVVIVEGEETTVDKKMCRRPGGGNYVVAV